MRSHFSFLKQMHRSAAAYVIAAALATPLAAQQPDMAVINRIKAEGWQRSQVMDISSWLIDVYGPRLTNSPIMRMAANWTLKKYSDIGLVNSHFEYFNFGRGWINEKSYMQVVAPVPFAVAGGPGSWMVGTNGLVRGEVVCVDPQPSTDDDYARLKGTLRNKIVVTAPLVNVNPMFTAPARRHTDSTLNALVNNQPGLARAGGPPAAPARGGRAGGADTAGRGAAGRAAAPPAAPAGRAGAITNLSPAPVGSGCSGIVFPPPPAPDPAAAPAAGGRGGGRGGAGGGDAARRTQFYIDEGVLAIMQPSTSATNNGNYGNGPGGSQNPNTPIPRLAAFGAMAEHYNRIVRQLQRGVNVIMELDIQNRFTGEDLNSMNIVGEILGTDKRDEVVMIGGHFDSWHQGTGATDNGCSCAVMIEAMRILKAANVPLRRTVRIALWTGEEQGLIGSARYVAEHFAARGPAPAPDPTAAVAAGGGGRGGGRGGGPLVLKPDHAKFSVYYNQDNGCGAIRGVYTQGNEAAVPVFRDWLRHVDSDSISVRHITPANTGGTDHQSFDAVGLPGFQFIQDPMDYGTRTHHFSQDLYERLVPRDMKHNATTIAVLVYLAANSNTPFPRKPPATPGGL